MNRATNLAVDVDHCSGSSVRLLDFSSRFRGSAGGAIGGVQGLAKKTRAGEIWDRRA